MNSIVRNFVFVISRFKMASFLNVAGLSVAFTAFLILFMQIRYEWGYDRFHKHADRLYRLEIVFNNTGAQVVLNRPLIDRFLASSPHIEEGALINQWGDKIYITVDRDGERMTFHEELYACYPSYARVFNFDMVEGEAAALEEKGRHAEAAVGIAVIGKADVRQIVVCTRLVYAGKEGLQGFLALVKTMESDHVQVIFTIPACKTMECLVKEWSMGAFSENQIPLGMVRVVNVERVLKKAAYRGNGQVILGITNSVLPQNNGSYWIRFTNGTLTAIERMPQDQVP